MSNARRKWVANASPIIVLAKVSQVRLLEVLSDELVIPSGVAAEIAQGSQSDPARNWIQSQGEVYVREPSAHVSQVTAHDLGAGETQVLSWAFRNDGFEALVDDRAARACASSLGIPVRGTLGIILVAKKVGLLQEVEPVFERIVEAGLRIDPDLIDAALRSVE